MSWAWLLGLAAGAYAWKALGLFGLSRITFAGPLGSLVAHLPAALFAGLIAQQALASGTGTEVATRIAGVVAGGVVAWRRGPLLVVIGIAALVTALCRLVV